MYKRQPFDPSTGQPIVVNRDNFYGLLARDFDIVESDTGTVTLEHNFTDSVSLRNQLRYTNTRKDFIVTKPEYTAGANTVTRASRSRDSEDDILINQTDLSVDFVTGPVNHKAVLGAELSRETSKNRGRTIPAAVAADKFFPNPDDPYNGNIVSASLAAESTSYTAALYGVDTLEIGRYWELNGSLRWDNFSTDFTNAASQDFSNTDSTINYRVGLVFKPTSFGSIYGGYGTSVNPSAEGLTLSDATDELEPEETVTYELGTKWDLFDERLAIAAAIFRTQKTNARTSAGGGAVTVLDGEQRVDGFEFSLTGNITQAWRLFGGYTFMDSEIESSNNAAEVGKKFANIPDHSLSLWTAYQITPEIDVGFGAVYASERFANNTNTRFLPDYWRFDAMAGYRFNEHVDVRLNILNLTNTTYYDSTHVGQHALVGAGKRGTVEAEFDFIDEGGRPNLLPLKGGVGGVN